MVLLVEVPQGQFLVEVQDKAVWRAIKLGCALQGIYIEERAIKRGEIKRGERRLSESDILLIASTCPCPKHMAEIATSMGFA